MSRLLGRMAAMAVAVVTCWVVLATSTAGAGPGQAEPEAPAPPAATIELIERPPWMRPEDTGAFVVRIAGAPEDASVRLQLFSALEDIETLERSETENVGRRLFRSSSLPVEDLANTADGNRVVVLRTTEAGGDATAARLSRPGVHPVVITLRAADGSVLDEIRTPVLRLGDADHELSAPALAVLLDVAAPPSLRPDGSRALADATISELRTVGDLIAAHPDLELSTAVVPDTLDALAQHTETTTAELLTRLQASAPLSAPYVRVAVESLLHADLLDLLPPVLERGRRTIADVLGREPRPAIWDPTSDFSDAAGETLGGLGMQFVLVRASELRAVEYEEEEEDDHDVEEVADVLTAVGPVELTDTGPLRGLVIDDALSEFLGASVGERDDAGHVALARLLVGGVSDGEVVLVRPRLAARSTLDALLGLLERDDAPIAVGGLDLAFRGPEPDEVADPREWRGPGRPDLSAIATRVRGAASSLDTFEATLDPRSTRAEDLRLQLLTAIAADTPSADRETSIDILEATVHDSFAAIRLTGQNDLNLTSRRGTLPVTIENANGFPVRVVVRLRSDRLSFPQGQSLAVTVTEETQRIDVPVEALATGSVPVFVELWTGDDRVRLDTRHLNVRSTAISGVGLTLSLGALAVLVVWWVRSWRRSRAERAQSGADVSTG